MTTIELDPISNPIFLFPKQSESDDTVTVVVEGLLHIADAAVKPESLSAQWTIELERDDVVHPIDVLRPSEIRAEGQHGNDSIYRITLIFLLPQTWAPTSSSPFETISHHVTASLGQTGSDDYCTHQIPIQVISMHDPPGQLRRVTAQNRLGMSRAGSIEINIHSDNLVLGSAFFVCLILSDLAPTTTILSIDVSLIQITQDAQDLSQHQDDVFTLFRAGMTQLILDRTAPPPPGQYLWRGIWARTLDSLRARQGNATVLPQPTLPKSLSATESTLHLQVQPRIPSPVIGGQQTTPLRLPNCVSSVRHSIRFAITYNTLDQAASRSGRPPREGRLEVERADFPVKIGSCLVVPDNIVIPPYSADSHLGNQWETSEDSTISDFTSFGLKRRGRKYGDRGFAQVPTEPSRLEQDFAAHHRATNGHCMCFYTESGLPTVMGLFNDKDAADAVGAEEYVRQRESGDQVK